MSQSAQCIVAWQPLLTDHQAYTYSELSRISQLPIYTFVSRIDDRERTKQGWTDVTAPNVNRTLITSRCFLITGFCTLWRHRSDVHIFGSPFEELRFCALMVFAALLRIKFYLISEPYSPEPFSYHDHRKSTSDHVKAALRPYLYKIYVAFFARHAVGVFAISKLAVEQYINAGMNPRTVHEFGYFVPLSGQETNTANGYSGTAGIRALFVGSMIQRKGLDVLADALSLCLKVDCSVQVDLYGSGTIEGLIPADQISELRRVLFYRGRIPFGHSQSVMAEYDVLIIPSYFDGWGVVVNEAILAGIPVICSDRVGASSMAIELGVGRQFRSGNAQELFYILKQIAEDRSQLTGMKHTCVQAKSLILPSVAASYMFAVMTAPGSVDANKNPWAISDNAD